MDHQSSSSDDDASSAAKNLFNSHLARAPRRALGARRGVETTTSTLGAMSSPTSSSSLTEEFVDADLLTPLGLVALLGRADLHPAVREALRSDVRPPLECLSSGDLADASRVIGVRKRSAPPNPAAAAAALAAVNPRGAAHGRRSLDARTVVRPDARRRRLPRVRQVRMAREAPPASPRGRPRLRPPRVRRGRSQRLDGSVRPARVRPPRRSRGRLRSPSSSSATTHPSTSPRIAHPPSGARPRSSPDPSSRSPSRPPRLPSTYILPVPRPRPRTLRPRGSATGGEGARLRRSLRQTRIQSRRLRRVSGRLAGCPALVSRRARRPRRRARPRRRGFGARRRTRRRFRSPDARSVPSHGGGGAVSSQGVRAVADAQPRPARRGGGTDAKAHGRVQATARVVTPRRASGIRAMDRAAASRVCRVALLAGTVGGTSAAAVGAATGAGPLPSPPPPGTPRTFLPGFYFHAAATATERRRRARRLPRTPPRRRRPARSRNPALGRANSRAPTTAAHSRTTNISDDATRTARRRGAHPRHRTPPDARARSV